MATVQIQIQRQGPMQPWGFRLQGGRDFRMELSVKKVSPNTPAQGKVQPGDAIKSIGGYDATQMTHRQASEMIQNTGQVLQLTVQKGMYDFGRQSKGLIKFSPATAMGYSK
eukprot:GHVU01136152.1.p1 GENE.GHVU01136152.1~~GHVU01136152.1.p1  ORF type:complete len:111 (+),score=8.47 GHVU01136152.1:370-702(+)